MNSNVPIGADNDPNAPWNQGDNPEKEVEVTVSITLSKTVKIKVSDYTVLDSDKDENGEYFEDISYSDCDLRSEVERQVILPQDAYKLQLIETKARRDLEDWNVDDFAVNLEE